MYKLLQRLGEGKRDYGVDNIHVLEMCADVSYAKAKKKNCLIFPILKLVI